MCSSWTPSGGVQLTAWLLPLCWQIAQPWKILLRAIWCGGWYRLCELVHVTYESAGVSM